MHKMELLSGLIDKTNLPSKKIDGAAQLLHSGGRSPTGTVSLRTSEACRPPLVAPLRFRFHFLFCLRFRPRSDSWLVSAVLFALGGVLVSLTNKTEAGHRSLPERLRIVVFAAGAGAAA